VSLSSIKRPPLVLPDPVVLSRAAATYRLGGALGVYTLSVNWSAGGAGAVRRLKRALFPPRRARATITGWGSRQTLWRAVTCRSTSTMESLPASSVATAPGIARCCKVLSMIPESTPGYASVRGRVGSLIYVYGLPPRAHRQGEST